MKDLFAEVASHYHKPGLYDIIIERLKAQGIAETDIQREHLSAVDEFHVRGAEVSKELAILTNIKGKSLLDVGCGIGGPARMLAADFDCQVTGLDLTEEFIRTATQLSELLGLSDKTNFVVGNALALPFEDAAFDVVWTQHVQMNIPDKQRFYGEITRVLKPNGTFLFYDIFRTGQVSPTYPMPWAEQQTTSFLTTPEEVTSILEANGLSEKQTTDQTDAGIAFFEDLLAKIAESGPPKLGLSLVMGESAPLKLGNLLAALKSGVLQLQSAVHVKY